MDRSTRRASLTLLALMMLACAEGGVEPPDAGRAPPMDDGGPSCGPSGCPVGSRCVDGDCQRVGDADADGYATPIDCDDADPTVGNIAERPCSGACGDGLERCTDGTWAACDAPADCSCGGSESRQIPCEMCGVEAQQCVGGSWSTVSGCTLQGVCAPGAVEAGAACGRCGVQRRTCTDGCGWSDWECVEIPERCDYWVRPTGGSWTGYALRGGPFAPTTPVRGAVPLDGTDDALVFTDGTVHTLRRTCVPGETDCWVASEPLAMRFGEVGADTVLYVNDIPSAFRGDGQQGIDVITATRDIRYLRDVATGAITHEITSPAGAWMAPAPRRDEVRAAFSVLGDPERWLTRPCGTPEVVPTDFIAHVASASVHVFAPGEGCGFYDAVPYADFPPFGEAGAPPLERVAATFQAAGLFVLGE